MPLENNEFKPTFEKALSGLGTYPSFDQVPKAQFRSIFKLMEAEGVDLDTACEAIADSIVGATREQVKHKLMNCRPSQREVEPRRRLDHLGSLTKRSF